MTYFLRSFFLSFFSIVVPQHGPLMSLKRYILGAFCVVGTICNLVAFVILQQTKDSNKNSTNWLLRALAIIDTLYLLARLLASQFEFSTCRDTQWLPLAVSRLFAAIAPYVAASASLLHMVSVWTLVVIIVDRYIAVCLPTEVQLRTVRRAKVAVACVVIVSAICYTPHFLEWKYTSSLRSQDCDDFYSVEGNFHEVPVERFWWLVGYELACECLLRTVVPSVVLIALCGRILARLRRMTRLHGNRRKFRFLRKKRRRVDWRKRLRRSLIVVVGQFIVCQLPQLILRISILLLQLSSDFHLNKELLRQISDVVSGLLVANAAANFFICCVIGNTFGRILAELFQRRSARNIRSQNQKNEIELKTISKPAEAVEYSRDG